MISLLFHTLQAGDLYPQYVADAKGVVAKEAGDDELASFLEAPQSDAIDSAAKAKNLLAARMKS